MRRQLATDLKQEARKMTWTDELESHLFYCLLDHVKQVVHLSDLKLQR